VIGIGHDDGRLAVFEDVGNLVTVKASVHRNGHEAGVPNGELGFKVLGPVAHHDGDSVAGGEAEGFAKTASGTGGAGGELDPTGVDALALGQRWFIGPQAAMALHPNGQVHRVLHSLKLKTTS
jgi:hypothetical protein